MRGGRARLEGQRQLGSRAQVQVRVYGPARSAAVLTCTGTPASTATYEARTGKTTTPPLKLDKPGLYAYQLVVPSSADVIGTTTPCPATRHG